MAARAVEILGIDNGLLSVDSVVVSWLYGSSSFKSDSSHVGQRILGSENNIVFVLSWDFGDLFANIFRLQIAADMYHFVNSLMWKGME